MRLFKANEVFPVIASLEVKLSNIREDLLADDACGPALRVYLVLSSGVLGTTELTLEDRFYNRYYWFLRLAEAHRRKFGFDAGIEQQAFQILEDAVASCELDPEEIERVEAAARIIE